MIKLRKQNPKLNLDFTYHNGIFSEYKIVCLYFN